MRLVARSSGQATHSLLIFVLLSIITAEVVSAPAIALPQIQAYLKRKSSPLLPSATTFLEQGRLNGVDPRLAIAISGAETGFGVRVCTPFNAWNYFWCGAQRPSCPDAQRCARSPMASWDEGIAMVNRYLKKRFIAVYGGRARIETIGAIYCPEASCGDWIPNVSLFYGDEDELAGDLLDLRFQ